MAGHMVLTTDVSVLLFPMWTWLFCWLNADVCLLDVAVPHDLYWDVVRLD